MPIPVTTTFTIEGYRIRKYLGVVRGIIVRAPTISTAARMSATMTR